MTFTVDPSSTSGCTIAANTVTFGGGVGSCAVDANAPTTSAYSAASSSRTLEVAQAPQTITNLTGPSSSPTAGTSATLTATGGGSGLPVTFTVDSSSTPGACSVQGSTLSFVAAGTCVVDADEAGSADYLPAPQVQSTWTVVAALPSTDAFVLNSAGGGGGNVALLDTTTGTVSSTTALPSDPGPDGPTGEQLSPSGGQLWVALPDNNLFAVENTATQTIEANVTIPSGIGALAFTSTTAFAAEPNANAVAVVSLSSDAVGSLISLPSSPLSLAVSPSGGTLYVGLSTGVEEVDTATGSVTRTITLASPADGLSVSPSGSELAVESSAGAIEIVDTSSGAIVASTSVAGTFVPPIWSPSGSQLYVVSGTSSATVSVFNATTGALTNTITVAANPVAATISSAGSQLYVVSGVGSSATLSVLNTASESVSGTVSLPSGRPFGPGGIALTPAGDLLVAGEYTNEVSVVDTATNTVTSNVTSDYGPVAVVAA